MDTHKRMYENSRRTMMVWCIAHAVAFGLLLGVASYTVSQFDNPLAFSCVLGTMAAACYCVVRPRTTCTHLAVQGENLHLQFAFGRQTVVPWEKVQAIVCTPTLLHMNAKSIVIRGMQMKKLSLKKVDMDAFLGAAAKRGLQPLYFAGLSAANFLVTAASALNGALLLISRQRVWVYFVCMGLTFAASIFATWLYTGYLKKKIETSSSLRGSSRLCPEAA